MRVICIDTVNVGDAFKSMTGLYFVNNDDCIYGGEVYTVVEEKTMFGRVGYRLAEKHFNNLYLKSRFIPLSNIDEIELVNEKIKQREYDVTV